MTQKCALEKNSLFAGDRCRPHGQCATEGGLGFAADWAPERACCVYFNSVLARAEVESKYHPSHQLWLRTRNGFCTFIPDPQLRAHHTGNWSPWKQWLSQPLAVTGSAIKHNEVVLKPDAESA